MWQIQQGNSLLLAFSGVFSSLVSVIYCSVLQSSSMLFLEDYQLSNSTTETEECCGEILTMAATPIEIGMRGTIGALISQEIEYFRRFEVDCWERFHKPKAELRDVPTTSRGAASSRQASVAVPVKKKRPIGGSKFLPSICSMVEITEANMRVNRRMPIHNYYQ